MLLITGTIRLPAGRMSEAQGAIEAVLTASRAEDGCVQYSYAADLLDAGLIHITERWTDREALMAHARAAHIKTWRAAAAELGVGERNLSLFEVGEPEAI